MGEREKASLSHFALLVWAADSNTVWFGLRRWWGWSRRGRSSSLIVASVAGGGRASEHLCPIEIVAKPDPNVLEPRIQDVGAMSRGVHPSSHDLLSRLLIPRHVLACCRV
jgi:hypothetical protein